VVEFNVKANEAASDNSWDEDEEMDMNNDNDYFDDDFA